MSTQTFEASSVDQALEEAAGALGIAAGELQYEVEEKASDFWGLGETVYVVTVTLPEEAQPEPEPAGAEPEQAQAEPDQPQAEDATEEAAASEAPDTEEAATATDDEATPAPEEPAAEASPAFFSSSESAPGASEEEAASSEAPAEEAEPRADESEAPETPTPTAPTDTTQAPADTAPADGTDLTKEAAGILDGIFVAMGFECTAEAKLDGDTMQVAITGEDNQYLLEGRGRGLAALELILNHSFRAWPNRAHKRVRVDAGDFRSQRDDEIRDMAYQVAHLAKETGSEQQTSDLNPYERRIVHLTLAEDHQVTTRSLGNGFLKAVNVIPTGGGERRDR